MLRNACEMMRLVRLTVVVLAAAAAAFAPSQTALADESPSDILILDVDNDYLFVRPNASIVIDMDVRNLSQKVNGCQAMFGYNSEYFRASPGCIVPGGGGVWDELIYNSWDVNRGIPGEIDTAIGVWAHGTVGTDADGTVASIRLTARGVEGRTSLVFRPDAPADDTKQTFLAGITGETVWPLKLDSQTIVIDGTTPEMNNLTTTMATPCLVEISVYAIDRLAGLVEAPTVILTGPPDAPNPDLIQGEGPVYVWQVSIDELTENYGLVVVAVDLASNYLMIRGNIHIVYLDDLERLSYQWLLEGPKLTADFNKDNTVNFKDFAVMAGLWLQLAPPDWPF